MKFQKTNEKLGQFPYPTNSTEIEPPALTWVRNYSSYLTVGGFFNYLQVAGVYIRGILVNLAILAPLILIVAVVPARFHHVILNHPFAATGSALLLLAVAIAAFLIRGPFDLVAAVSNRLAGDRVRDGSVSRMGKEKLIAWSLLALAAGLAIDSTPRLIEFVRLNQSHLDLSLTNISAGIVGIAAVAGSASRFLDRFESRKARFGVAVVGLISLTIPYLMLLGVTNYLVYGIVPTRSMYASLVFVTAIAFVTSVCVALRVCKTDRMTIANKVITSLVAVAFLLVIPGLVTIASMTGDRSVIVSEYMVVVSNPLSRLASVEVPSDARVTKSRYFQGFSERQAHLAFLGDSRFSADGFIAREAESFSIVRPGSWLNWLEDRDTDAEYFLAASSLLEAGERLHYLDSIDQTEFLKHATETAYATILDAIEKKRSHDDRESADDTIASLLIVSLDAGFSVINKDETKEFGLDLAQYADHTASSNRMDQDFLALKEKRLPGRLSASFLSLTGREQEEAASNNEKTNDVDLSGPFLFP